MPLRIPLVCLQVLADSLLGVALMMGFLRVIDAVQIVLGLILGHEPALRDEVELEVSVVLLRLHSEDATALNGLQMVVRE